MIRSSAGGHWFRQKLGGIHLQFMATHRIKHHNQMILPDNAGQGKSQIFVQAGILAAASIVVRIIGLLYQSPLTAIIGDEGNGYYSLAYNIYTIVLLISSYSIPSAISKLMAEKLAMGEYRNAQRIFRAALWYVLAAGAAGSAVLYFGAGLLVGPGSVPVLRVFAPTIFLFGLLGALRGYFQAHSTMLQTSVSQIIEQIVNAAMSLLLAYALMRRAAGAGSTTQAVYGASGSALGTGSGVLAALLFMLWVYSINRRGIRTRMERDTTGTEEPYRKILWEVICVVTPFVLSSFILNLTTSLNQTIYTKILMAGRGMDEIGITVHYGIFSRKATVITNIPISIATATSAAVIPSISGSFARGDGEETLHRARQAVMMTALVAIPCTVALIFLAKPVTMILFPQMDSLNEASALLALLAVTVFFYSISTITNAVLQATKHMNLPLVSAVAALAVQTAVLVLLLVRTNMGTYALVAASVIYSVMIFAANELFLRKYMGPGANLGKRYAGPVAAALLMGITSLAVYDAVRFLFARALHFGVAGQAVRILYFANLAAFLPAFVTAVLVYAFALVKMRVLDEEMIRSMPKGNHLVRVLQRLRWM